MAFFAAIGVSTIFAVHKYRAFFGDVERGEGFVGLFFLFAFFVLAYLLFEKKDWQRFFGLSIATGAVLFLHGGSQFLSGSADPASFTGNRIYLGGYFLFMVFAGLVFLELHGLTRIGKRIYTDIGKRMYADSRSLLLGGAFFVLFGLAGVLLSNSRGPLLGFAAGIAAAVVYFSFVPLRIGDLSVSRKIPAAALGLMVLLASVFWATRTADVWQNVPALNRLIAVSLADATTQTRLISWGVALRSVNPANVGVGRFLVGWGQENYNIAYNAFYNPDYLTYEQRWFDRAHNKLFDVLVMSGILGIVAYAAIWFFVFYGIARQSPTADNADKKLIHADSGSLMSGAALFFGVAYFTQNLVAFDSLVTYVPLFAFLAFLTRIYTDEKQINTDISASIRQNSHQSAAMVVSSAAAAIALLFLVWATLIPYFQMRNYTKLLKSGLPVPEFLKELDSVLHPYTYAQDRIRTNLLGRISEFQQMGKQEAQPIVEKTLSAMRELVSRERYEPRHFMTLGRALHDLGLQENNSELLEEAERSFRGGIALAPRRQELLYYLAENLVVQKRLEEAQGLAEEMLAAAPDVPLSKMLYAATFLASDSRYNDRAFEILQDALKDWNPVLVETQMDFLRNVYNNYMIYFYNLRDKERFSAALQNAYRIELEWRKRNEAYLREGRIRELPPDRVSELARAVEEFPERGFDVIRVAQ